MLPSTFLGVLPSLRNLITPHAGLLLLRFRLGVARHSLHGSLSSTRLNTHASSPISIPKKESVDSSSEPSMPLPEPPEPKLSLTFTCAVTGCGERSRHQFTKRSYEKGIVLVQCPGCKNRHLIADHLGWFKESTQDGKLRTVEDLVKAKGEKVRRGRLDVDGTVEWTE